MEKLLVGSVIDLVVPTKKQKTKKVETFIAASSAKKRIYIGMCFGFFTGVGLFILASFTENNTKKWKPTSAASSVQIEYVKKYKKIAREESDRYGIPASIILAQGLLESKAGTSKLAAKNNNHFGIKCFLHQCHKGHCSNFADDSHKDFFRIYSSASESFNDHSKFLSQPRYRWLKSSYDVEVWCEGLQRLGYATSKTYAVDLLGIVRKLDLKYFDK